MNISQAAKELRFKANRLQAQAEKYYALASSLEELEGDELPLHDSVVKVEKPKRAKRVMSEEGREAIRRAQKARWRRFRKNAA